MQEKNQGKHSCPEDCQPSQRHLDEENTITQQKRKKKYAI